MDCKLLFYVVVAVIFCQQLVLSSHLPEADADVISDEGGADSLGGDNDDRLLTSAHDIVRRSLNPVPIPLPVEEEIDCEDIIEIVNDHQCDKIRTNTCYGDCDYFFRREGKTYFVPGKCQLQRDDSVCVCKRK